MQFSIMRTEVCQQTGLDSTDSTVTSNVNRWLNMMQQDIVSRWPWPFLLSRELVQTVADKTAGTVTISNASSAVTGSGTAFASTDVGKYIQFSGANDWYVISAYTSATSITIEDPLAASTVTAGTYIIRKFFYSLSSSADTIYTVKNWNTPLRLAELDPRTLDDLRPNPQSTGTSTAFLAYGLDSSGNIQVSPYPFPNDVRNIEIRTWKRVSDMSADADLSVIPAKWHHVIVWGANFLAFRYLRKKDDAAQWLRDYENKIADMITKDRLSEDELPVLQPVDNTTRSNFIRMPDGYPALR